MFTLLGFAFDWFVISSLVIELFGCGIGCTLLRSSGQYEDSSNNDSVGIGTLVAFTICTVIALCVLGFGGYISIGPAAHWVYSNPYAVGIGAGASLGTEKKTCASFEREAERHLRRSGGTRRGQCVHARCSARIDVRGVRPGVKCGVAADLRSVPGGGRGL